MIRWLIRAAVSAVVVAILLSLIPLGSVLDALGRISVWTWSAGVGVLLTGHALNALKVRLLLRAAGSRATGLTSACIRAQFAGLVANLGLPGLAGGDLVRAAYLVPKAGLKAVAVATVTDRVIDTVTLFVLVGLALPFAGMPPLILTVVEHAGEWIAAGIVLAIVGGLVLMRLPRFAGLPARIADARRTLAASPWSLFGAVLISVSVQSAFVMTNVWLARQAGVTTGLAAWFVAWPLSKLVAVLPISLGGLGVREAALVSLLAPYGAPREAVLASGILWQAVFIVTSLVGLVVTQALIHIKPADPAALRTVERKSGVSPLAKET
jgi:uncharacterized membrane protein YbhN (UPF0104 family)